MRNAVKVAFEDQEFCWVNKKKPHQIGGAGNAIYSSVTSSDLTGTYGDLHIEDSRRRR
jgi:hypothetical protein